MSGRVARTAQEKRQDDRLEAFMRDAQTGKAQPKAYVPPADPLRRYIDQTLGTREPETVADRSTPALSAGWMRLTDREREACASPVPWIRAEAEKKLQRYADAVTDPELPGYDPVAAGFLERARNAPRTAPEPVETPQNTPEEEAIQRQRNEVNPYGGMAGIEYAQARRAALYDEIVAERAAAEPEEEAE